MKEALTPWTPTRVMEWSARELQNAQQLEKCGLDLFDSTEYDADDSHRMNEVICGKTGFAIVFRGADMFTFWDEFGTGRTCYQFTSPGNLLAFVQNAPHCDDSTEEELTQYAAGWTRFVCKEWPCFV